MTDIIAMQIEDSVPLPFIEVNQDDIDPLDISKEGAWIVSQLDEMSVSGEYTGETTSARDAVLSVADQIERGGVAMEARKPVADILRFLAQFVSTRQIPIS